MTATPDEDSSEETPRHATMHWIVIGFVLILFVFTIFALTSNYLKITMIFFKANSFSMLTAIKAIYGMNLYCFATLMVIYLIVMPFAWIVCLFVL
jgi:hypothetical protein